MAASSGRSSRLRAALVVALAGCPTSAYVLSSGRTVAPEVTNALRAALRAAPEAVAAEAPLVSRRDAVAGGLGTALAAFAAVCEVDASGGATAGGAYLLRAKERYNARVEAGVKDFRRVKPAVDAGDAATIGEIFVKDGSYDDLTAAAFLLSNAFRINSTQNPDKIPQVQKFKAFKAAADAIPASLKKKKMAAVQQAYAQATDLLDVYLDSVGLS